MLQDVIFKQTVDPITQLVCSVNNQRLSPSHIGKGQYVIGHWNPELIVKTPFLTWRDEDEIEPFQFKDRDGNWFSEYGVCDTPEQLLEKIDLESPKEKFVVFYVQIRRKEQPMDGGWRFHKWGPYIGNHEIEHEYLYDQKDINVVYTYHIYQIKE